MDKLEKQKCPVCFKNILTLTEDNMEIPYFGRVFLFSMQCQDKECNYNMSDVETEEQKEPTRYTLEINSEKDMNIRVVKSSNAGVKIPQLKMSMEPGIASVGFVSNVEGILDRFKKVIEEERNSTEDEEVKEIARPWIENKIDLEKVKKNLFKSFLFISDNDPFNYFELNKEKFSELGSEIIVLPNAGHITEDDGFKELPILLDKF